MRKAIAVLLLLLLLPVYVGGEAADGLLADDTPAGYLRDACSRKDGIAVLGSDGVWLYQPDTGGLTPLLRYEDLSDSQRKDKNALDMLFAVEDDLILCASSKNTFFRVGTNSLEPCLENTKEIFAYEDLGESRSKEWAGAAASEEGIYLLLRSLTFENGWASELYLLKPDTGDAVFLGKQDADRLYCAENGNLLAGRMAEDGESLVLLTYDREAGAFVPLDEKTYSAEAAGFVWDGQRLCRLEPDGAVVLTQSGQERTVSYIPYEYLYPWSRAFCYQNQYVYLQDSELTIRSMDTDPDSFLTLKILGKVSGEIVRQYMAENPGIRIVFDYREDTFHGLQDALISKDEGVDLFLVASDGIYREVIEKGYCAAMTDSQILMNRTAGYYPWARELLIRDGQLYAVPVGADCECWTLNRTMWEKLEMGRDPRTYEDVFRAMDRWDEMYADSWPEYSVFESDGDLEGILKTLVRQYLLVHEDWTEPVSFDSEEFRAAVQSIQNYAELFEYDGESLPLIMNYPQYLGRGYNDADLVESILPPALTEESEQAVRVTMEMLMLNPLSAHRSEALRFLEYYTDHLDDETAYRLDETRNEPVRMDDYESTVEKISAQIDALKTALDQTKEEEEQTALSERLDSLQRTLDEKKQEWKYSPEDLEIWHRIAEKAVAPTRTIYPEFNEITDVIDGVIEQYAEGSLDLEEFIQKMNEKARIIYMEQ